MREMRTCPTINWLHFSHRAVFSLLSCAIWSSRTNTKNILAHTQTKRVFLKREKESIVHGIWQTITTITSSITLDEWMEDRALFSPLLLLLLHHSCFPFHHFPSVSECVQFAVWKQLKNAWSKTFMTKFARKWSKKFTLTKKRTRNNGSSKMSLHKNGRNQH